MPQSATPVFRFSGPAAAAAGGELRRRAADLRRRAALAGARPRRRSGCAPPSPRRSRSGGAARCATPLETLVRQRVFQIACGYEDQDDADTLRTDPLLKLVCGRLPETRARPGQPADASRGWRTRSIARACYRLAVALGRAVPARARAGRRARRTSCSTWTAPTTRPTAQQEGSAYHGYYRQHMYHPLLVFDGETDQLITAVLRPGNAHGSRGVVAGAEAAGAGRCGRAGRGCASSCARTAASPCRPLRLVRGRKASPTPSG